MRFPVQPGLPPQLAAGLHWWLEAHSSEYRNIRPGLTYASSEEFVLREAGPTAAWYDQMGGVPDMQVGNCFHNAWEVAQQNHRYVYFEGWAVMDHGLPAHHAWLWDTWNRKVEDPTWRNMYVTRRASYPDEPWTGCGVYWGVPIHPVDHTQWALRHNYPNLLAVYDEDYQDVLLLGRSAFGSRPAIDHNPPVVFYTPSKGVRHGNRI